MKTVKRRTFIKKSMLVSAGVALGAPAYIKGYAQQQPSDIVNVAVAGINDRGGLYGGSGHTANYTKIKESRVVALCDPVDYLFPKAIKDIEDLGGPKPKTVEDFRNLLDDKEIDAISIASPGYWHALMSIWACQAGKDVYVEKPVSWSIDEGRKMVQAARKYNRIMQAGVNRRSNRVSLKAIELLRDGVIGDIYMGRYTVYRSRDSIGRVKDSPVPKGVNWDLFRGPAPMIPFNENHFLYKWHWYWDTSTTEFGNNGIHGIDRVRQAMNKNEHPVKVACCGGFYAYDSDQEVPNLEVATFEYADGSIIELEVRSLPTPGDTQGLLWLGTKGYAMLGNSFEAFVTGEKPVAARTGQNPPVSATGGRGSRGAPEPTLVITNEDLPVDTRRDELSKARIEYHFQNFIDCVKSRKVEDLEADILEGHLSTSLCHLGNTAYRTGRKLTFDGKTEKYVNDKEANTYLARPGGGRKPFNIPDKV